MKTERDWLKELEVELAKRHLLHHPFYERWAEGALTKEALRGYAQEYYQLVAAFPEMVWGVQSRAPSAEMAAGLEQNLRDEEQHPALWLQFGEALGLSRQDMVAHQPLPETREAIDALRRLTYDQSFLEGTAALWGFESQVPAVSEKKIEGLHDFYGVNDPRGLEYFLVHRKVDEEHTAVEGEILRERVRTPQEREKVKAAARDARNAVWRLLDGVLRAYVPASNMIVT